MGEEKMPTIEEALDEIKTKPLVDIWPTLCVAVGVSKGAGYEAVTLLRIATTASHSFYEGLND